MRDVLTLFLEASAARGAWEAAITAWHTAAREGTMVSGSHTMLLRRILLQAGRWSEAAHITTGGVTCSSSQIISARSVTIVAASNLNFWNKACQHLQDIQRSAAKHKQISASPNESGVLAEAFECHVSPHIPDSQRDTWMRVMCNPGRDHPDHSLSSPPTACESPGRHNTNGEVPVTNNEELLYILRRPKERSSWSRAIQLLLTMPHPNAASVNIVLGILSRQGRQNEAMQVVTTFTRLRAIHPTAVTVKVLAEAANTMRSQDLCNVVLRTPALRSQITPQSAVPLVMALQLLGDWRSCLEWWKSLSSDAGAILDPSGGGNISGVQSYKAAQLRSHLKLSSYVAVCVARSGQWVESLAAMRDAASHDPPLAVLFALRALRVAGQWTVAMRVFKCNRNIWERSPIAFQVSEVMIEQNAESWIPLNVLRALRAHHAERTCSTTGGGSS